MNTPPRFQRGFTLIELLVVIAIIGILAGILLPVLSGVQKKGQAARAQQEVTGLAAAIKAFETDYSYLPIRKSLASSDTDLTFGFPNTAENAEVMTILTAEDHSTYNPKHRYNYKKLKFFEAKGTSDKNKGGLGPDHNLRDPWGNPYIISLDVNGDGKTLDALYKTQPVSKGGLNGLQQQDNGEFAFSGVVMVWSFGPDQNAKMKDGTKTFRADTYSKTAAEPPNKDNLLSWK